MFGRNNGLLLVVGYAIALLIVGVAARTAFVFYNQNSGSSDVVIVEPDRLPVLAGDSARNKAIHYDYAAVAAANERLTALQSSLERATTQLHEKSQQLNQRDAECRVLEEKLDESVAFAMELLVQEPSATRDDQTAEAKATLERDLAALKKQLRDSQTLSKEHTERLAALRTELMQADLEIASLRERAELEITALIEERISIEAVTGDLLREFGEIAVPSLITSLQHRQPEVRLWAATMLGKLGLNATTAIEPLINLTKDPEPQVAAAARRALTLIEP